ncbi:glucuronate isomerase [Thioclava dalianensis]|uniref:Uronate isomerase n=1 Tax=Thioclava dalianensis TaxID=1185766 RepID=A0A074U2R9_9RHOB|nr:glucuronate isomerase [Thioclava dalianensis]KEP68952.1 glucuronate isomerase [Thioclava dalianensis]SFN73929.1 glucuronate isomerase [Thioclava dalianensis]
MAQFLDPDRLFPADPAQRNIARDLYESVQGLPIVSPHGHTDPGWFAHNPAFSDATSLFLTPDHYVLRMLKSQGLSYDDLGVPRRDGAQVAEPRAAWRHFAAHYHLFAGTPSQLWIDHAMSWGFGISERLSAGNADAIFDTIGQQLPRDEMRPLAILDRANVEVIATTEFALDPLEAQGELAAKGLTKRVRTTYRPDDVTDPDHPDFAANLARLGALTDCDTARWEGLIEAHRRRRATFRSFGACATDHGVPTARTADLAEGEKQPLLDRVLSGDFDPQEAELFRAQMLSEMAALSVEDGMVMQIHAGVMRNTDPELMRTRGPNLGADIPQPVSPAQDLGPLLRRFGNAPGFRLIFFCLDESVLSRELAPMAGYWPALRLGPPWWFHDSPRGIARYLDGVVESAGFLNLAGFNDDTRALLSIPARHDVWRRCCATFLADMVARHLIDPSHARELAGWLSYDAAREAYRLD